METLIDVYGKRNIIYSARIKWNSIPLPLLSQLIEKAKQLGATDIAINYIENDYVLQFFNLNNDEKIKSEIDEIVKIINSVRQK